MGVKIVKRKIFSNHLKYKCFFFLDVLRRDLWSQGAWLASMPTKRRLAAIVQNNVSLFSFLGDNLSPIKCSRTIKSYFDSLE